MDRREGYVTVNGSNRTYRRRLTESEIGRIKRRKLKHKLINIGLVFLILLSIVGFSFSYYMIAVLTAKTTISQTEIPVGTMTEDEFDPVRTTVLGFDVTKYGDLKYDVDFNKVGEYTIYYRPFLSKNTSNIKVNVVDNDAPTIKLLGDAVKYEPNVDEFLEPGYHCVDNYDGDLSSQVKVNPKRVNNNEYRMKYTVSDSSGNRDEAERVVYSSEKTTVYLTFDDGPNREITPQILEILDRYGVPATFFVNGFDYEDEGLIRQEIGSGHTVGLHGYSQDYSIYQSADSVMENFRRLETAILNETGYTSKVIRFPGGSSNTVSREYCEGVMTEVTQKAIEEGYSYFDWNIDSGDIDETYSANDIYLNVIRQIEFHHMNVVLLHDGAGHQNTVDALERIIQYCIGHDFELRALTIDSNPVRHEVQN